MMSGKTTSLKSFDEILFDFLLERKKGTDESETVNCEELYFKDEEE